MPEVTAIGTTPWSLDENLDPSVLTTAMLQFLPPSTLPPSLPFWLSCIPPCIFAATSYWLQLTFAISFLLLVAQDPGTGQGYSHEIYVVGQGEPVAVPWVKWRLCVRPIWGMAELEEDEGHGIPGSATHTLQLVLQVLLENRPEGFSEGWRKAQH